MDLAAVSHQCNAKMWFALTTAHTGSGTDDLLFHFYPGGGRRGNVPLSQVESILFIEHQFTGVGLDRTLLSSVNFVINYQRRNIPPQASSDSSFYDFILLI